ncbi:AAA family ATPase [Streptomyces sp. NPDC051286]|uniref:AAA family ATPase n=1 Tax=Streptomyces sp. NPDC051286 TaxID=3365647 RepID=UPI0037AF30DC
MGAITTKGRKLHQIEHVPYEKAFLIGDLLTSNITMLAGEPKAGKTNFAAGMSAALLNGADEFLGLPVLRPCRHIVFGLTDDGAEGELRERLHGAIPRDSVTVFPVEDTSQPGYWQGVHDDLVALGADLFVLDNVLGALGDGEDVASSVTARNTIDKLKSVSKSGIPVLAVTHTPKGNGEGLTTASAPIGGRAMAGGVRGVIVLRKSKKGRSIQTAINRARSDLDIAVTMRTASNGSEIPIWERVESGLKVVSLPKAKTWDEDLIARIIEEQPEEESALALSKRYAPVVDRKAETVRPKLRDRLERVDGRWVRKPADMA